MKGTLTKTAIALIGVLVLLAMSIGLLATTYSHAQDLEAQVAKAESGVQDLEAQVAKAESDVAFWRDISVVMAYGACLSSNTSQGWSMPVTVLACMDLDRVADLLALGTASDIRGELASIRESVTREMVEAHVEGLPEED